MLWSLSVCPCLNAVPRRLKKNAHGNNSPHQLGICFNTVEVKRGDDHCHQSTLTITAEDRDGAPYAWSGKEFRGEVVGKKAKAENAAARAFLADAAVQETAANMDPPNERQSTPNQKQRFLVLKELKRAKKAAKAAKAAARQRSPLQASASVSGAGAHARRAARQRTPVASAPPPLRCNLGV